MKKILIPTNSSALDDYVYDLAHKIAEKVNASLEVLSIIPAPANVLFDPEGNIKEDEGLDFSSLYKEKDLTEKRMQQWLANKPDVLTSNVKIGRVNDDILRYVKANNVDLIVMGTEVAVGLDDFLIDSHIEFLIRNSPVPVLTLKDDQSDLRLEHILLVSDFEKTEKLNLEIVKTIQSTFDATLNLLRVNTASDFKTHRSVKQHMQQYADLNDLKNVAFHIYGDDSVEEGILHFSDEYGINFVAIGTNQRKGLNRVLKRSLSKDLVNHLQQPVLVFSDMK